MVQFTRLRIVGFKSFVDPTDVVIEPGLTGIVGPNGCGKSNLVEALRWVMGETSAKQVRGSEMEDMIFAGASGRPGRNHAEVSVLLDNGDRSAPPAFNDHSEIEISRRIARGQGSAYRVNGKEARARDVQVLFADSSTGAGSAALVGQGQVANLINAKPTQRRSILEEAAGITGLHARRHEAELRLRAAEANLERLDDVMAALEDQLKGLKRQARQATRYRNISDHIRKAEAGVLYLKWRRAMAIRLAAQEALAATEAQVNERAEAAARAGIDRSRSADTLPGLREKVAEAVAVVQRFTLAGEQLDEEERRNRDAIANVQRQVDQIERDLEREGALRADADAALARLDQEQTTLQEARAGETAALQTVESEITTIGEALAREEAALSGVTESLAAEEAAQVAAKREIQQLDETIARLERRLGELKIEQEGLSGKIAADDERTQAVSATVASETARTEARETAETAESTHQAARRAHSAALETAQALRTERAKLEAEAATLRRMLEAAGDSRWPAVLDAIKVKRGFEKALAAALGDDLQGSVEDGGPLTWRQVPPPQGMQALPDGCRPLSDLAKAPAQLQLRLSQIGVLDDGQDPAALTAALQPGQRLVAVDGEMWRWDGFHADAGAPTAAAIRLEQRNQLDTVEAKLAEGAAAMRDADAEQSRTKVALAEAEQADLAARNAQRQADRAVSEAQTRLAQAERRAVEAEARLAGLNTAMHDAAQQLDEAQARRTGRADDLIGDDHLAFRRQERDRLRADVAERRSAQVDAQARREQLVREAEARARRLTAIEGERTEWRSRTENAESRRSDLTARRDDSARTLQTLQETPAKLATKRDALNAQRREAEEAQRNAADRLAEAETAARAADDHARQADSALAEARENRVRQEAARDAADQALQDALARIAERQECAASELPGRADLDPDDPAIDSDEILARLDERFRKLTKERDGMGPVNLRAIEEAEELEQRIEGLENERNDLLQAIARLRQGIAALNREGRMRLTAAFEKVNEHFKALFEQLFGGGRAHLELIGSEDPLEAGLEIMASPPGKHMQSLSLLSGGERTLTALALIFAVFRTNPAPICVLDEVDAPLDDANVDRFCRLLDELVRSLDTRFLLVTHHRLTMARMDRLYGVTMPEHGVSQLVSVDLGAAERMRAA